jgi:16S rRNA (cytosine1402-N4)-methyltransferase
MNKHVPVLLQETLNEFKTLTKNTRPLYAIDCTLGQAGHSREIFSKLEKGVLISIDLDITSISWVVTAYNLNRVDETKDIYECTKDQKLWRVIRSDFADIPKIQEENEIPLFDFILADLGFSNFQLDKNLGISFDRPFQDLDMRYDMDLNHRVNAAYVLNTFERKDLERIFLEYGQIEDPQMLVTEIVSNRKNSPFKKVGDFVRILQKSKFPKNFKVKAFQALRVYVNHEYDRLERFLDQLPSLLSPDGKALIISFNSKEEEIIAEKSFESMDIVTKAPNITEIISNPQSRSAKLHILTKKKKHKDQVSEE